jgi:hypothetical protein
MADCCLHLPPPKQVVPQSDVNTLLSRIQWAANNAETYNACFDDPDQLSDSAQDTVKLYRLQSILGSLTNRLQAAGGAWGTAEPVCAGLHETMGTGLWWGR